MRAMPPSATAIANQPRALTCSRISKPPSKAVKIGCVLVRKVDAATVVRLRLVMKQIWWTQMTVVAAAIIPKSRREMSRHCRRNRGMKISGRKANPAMAPRQKAAPMGGAAASRTKMDAEETAMTAGNKEARAFVRIFKVRSRRFVPSMWRQTNGHLSVYLPEERVLLRIILLRPLVALSSMVSKLLFLLAELNLCAWNIQNPLSACKR